MLAVDCTRFMLVLLGVQHSVCRCVVVSCVVCRVVSCVDIILSRCDLQRSAFRNVLVPTVEGTTARSSHRAISALT